MAEQNPKVKAGFLAGTLARKREELAAARRRTPERELRARAWDSRPPRPWAPALRGPDLRLVAEIKRKSPSAGPLAAGVDARELAARYEAAGAAALSVLTDAAFDGRIQDLEMVSASASIPVLRKDFILDTHQVWESRAAGADAILLIVAALDDDPLAELAGAARQAGLGLLVEVHDPWEAERARAVEPAAVGVNARDLETLEVALDRSLATLRAVREGWGPEVVLVAESGLRTPEDLERARAAGADAVLVGEHLMRSGDPAAALQALLGASGE